MRDDADRRRALDAADASLSRGRAPAEPLSLVEWLGLIALLAWAIALTVAELGRAAPPP